MSAGSRPKIADLIDLEEAAERTGVCERTLRRYIEAGRIRAWRLGPRRIKIDPDSLDDLLEPIGGAS